MNHDNHKKTVIDHTLEQSTPVPPEVEARLRARLAGFREKLESQGGATPRHGRHWILRAAVGAVAVFALGFAVWLSLTPTVTLADVQAAIEKRPWVHVVFDNGEEQWVSLIDHKLFIKARDGYLHFSDYTTNVRMDFWPETGAVSKLRAVLIPPDADPTAALQFAPKTALEVAGIGDIMSFPVGEATEEQKQQKLYVERHNEMVDGRRLIRFDLYFRDMLDRQLLSRQVWVDPQTSLPVRVRQRLSLGQRDTPDDEYMDGHYDFPDSGPADLYALGVPRDTAVIDTDAPTPADIAEIVQAATAARYQWPKRFRVMQWPADKASANYSGEVDFIWWDGVPQLMPERSVSYDGVKIRTQRYFNLNPDWNEQNRPYYLPVPATADHVLAWAETQTPVSLNISDGINAYSRNGPSHPMVSNPSPTTVQASPVRGSIGFNSPNWPTQYLWPFADMAPPTQMIADAPDADPGTILLRRESGNIRRDFYLDPAHDLICIKHTWWKMRAGEWVKEREYELAELAQLPEGQWYAVKRKLTTYDDPAKNIHGYEVTWNVDVKVLDEGGFPPDIFNGQKLLEEAEAAGAKIETP